MLPLTFAEKNEINVIKKVGGKGETKKHLEDMGFVTGALVSVISEVNGSLIVNMLRSAIPARSRNCMGKALSSAGLWTWV